MARPLIVNAAITIPAAEFGVSYARSAGPGGQNVNKVNSKAILRWRVIDSPSLPAAVRQRFLAHFGNRVTNDGEIVIAADEHREQPRNLTACYDRLRAMILSVAKPPTRRIKTRPSRGAVERRIQSKQRNSEKKQQRRGGFDSQ
jgi:ribosome-associated protein